MLVNVVLVARVIVAMIDERVKRHARLLSYDRNRILFTSDEMPSVDHYILPKYLHGLQRSRLIVLLHYTRIHDRININYTHGLNRN